MASDCKLCALLGATTCCASENEENLKAHGDLHALQLQLIEFTIEKPFMVSNGSDITPRNNRQIPKGKSNISALLKLCRKLVINPGKTIKCSQCDVTLIQSTNFEHRMVNHACVHLNKVLFACSYCDLKFITKFSVHGHLRNIHALSCKRENYVDMMDDHQGDITDMVKLCFGKSSKKNISVTALGRQRINVNKSSKHFALFNFSRELMNNYAKDSDMKCSLCKFSTRSQGRKTSNTVYSLINHACGHLDKDLFACRHCDLKFATKIEIRSHIQRIHALNFSSATYIDMVDDHQTDIIDMVEQCFGKASEKKLDVNTSKRRKRNRQGWTPLSTLAYDFILKHQGGEHIQCHLCPRSISKTARKIVDHARWHLGKLNFTCRLCTYSAVSESAIKAHLIFSHRVASSRQNYKDMSSDHYKEICTMLEDCFDEMKEDRSHILTKDQERIRQRQKKLLTRCGTNSLLAERQLRCGDLAQKFYQSDKLECRICHHQLILVNATTISYVHVPMRHAYSHFNKPVFNCRLCSYKSMTKGMIDHHVRTKHGVPSAKQFDDRTDDSHSDFMDMLSKCYDLDLEPSTSAGSSSSGSQKSKLSILSRTHGNDLKAARHGLALDLIKKHVKDGKMICRVCDQTTKVPARGGCGNLFCHALRHLDRRWWPYRCRLCSHTVSNYSSIYAHLQKTHKHAGGDGFEDMSDKFHEDIMKVLSKCYDWNVEVENMS